MPRPRKLTSVPPLQFIARGDPASDVTGRNASLHEEKALKRHDSPETIIADHLRSYCAAMTALDNAEKQEVGRWTDNRVENSQLSFRRRERTML